MNDFAVAEKNFIHDARSGRDQIHVVFALESLLHNVHVQQAEEAGTEAEAQGLRNFRFEVQRSIVEL
ncbi:hypothetical protein NGUA04_04596 [Salmonella enterica]|nr:hypothetical protein NGUA04_04596 [Salmonella enterica]